MSVVGKLMELTRALMTVDTQLQYLRERLDESRKEVHDWVSDVRNLHERFARLEVARDADRAELRADIARFKADLERTLLENQHKQLLGAQ